MLISINYLLNFDIQASDGSIGHVSTFLFDDQKWIIRYLVVDTGKWLPGRKVLIAPEAIGTTKGLTSVLPVNLTKDQIKGSPDINTDIPVSRQYEIELHEYYNWSSYWGGMLGPVTTPGESVAPVTGKQIKEELQAVQEAKESGDPNLRDTKKVEGYRIHAVDGEFGYIDDYIVDTGGWIIRYLVVDTRKWLPGKKVLIPPDWIQEISWVNSEVSVDVKKDTVKNGPEFNPKETINKEYEIKFYDYHGRTGYWV